MDTDPIKNKSLKSQAFCENIPLWVGAIVGMELATISGCG